jgi:flagellin-specific chaperone FliS
VSVHTSQISEESLNKFIKIYKKDFKKKLTRAEASEMASRLVTLYEILSIKLPNGQTPDPTPRDESEVHPPIRV